MLATFVAQPGVTTRRPCAIPSTAWRATSSGVCQVKPGARPSISLPSATSMNSVRTEFTEVADGGELESRAPSFTWQSPQDVAREAVEGMAKGQRVVAPGWTTKVVSTSGRLTPRPLLLPLMKRVYRKP